jgi:cell division septation protein DedD
VKTTQEIGMQKQARTFEVTIIHIWIAALIVLVVVTIAFEIGVLVGRKKAGIVPFTMMQQGNSQRRVGVEVPTERAPISADQVTKPFAAEEKEMQYEVSTDELAEEKNTGKETQYTIQVGAFSSRQNAEDMANSLQADGYTCWVYTESLSDIEEAINVVFVGRFETKQVAKRFGDMLLDRLADLPEYRIREIRE